MGRKEIHYRASLCRNVGKESVKCTGRRFISFQMRFRSSHFYSKSFCSAESRMGMLICVLEYGGRSIKKAGKGKCWANVRCVYVNHRKKRKKTGIQVMVIVGVKTLRDPKVGESCRKFVESCIF